MTKAIALVLGFLLGTLINGLVIMLAWNYVVSGVVGGPELTFFQALVLRVLVESLVKGVQINTNQE